MNFLRNLTLAAVLSVGGVAVADSPEEVAAKLADRFPQVDGQQITPTPIPGIYEVRLGAQIAYVSADGNYLIQGDIYDLNSEENLTERRRTAARVEAVDQVGESSMVIFGAEDAGHTVTVFTDIDCGYCRKLHRQMADYNAEDIRVRYMFFPRSGPETESWVKADKVWCSEDRNSALTRAKAGEVIEADDCGSTPVAQHYDLGVSFGIRGTPAILLESGEIVPGYVPPAELADHISTGL